MSNNSWRHLPTVNMGCCGQSPLTLVLVTGWFVNSAFGGNDRGLSYGTIPVIAWRWRGKLRKSCVGNGSLLLGFWTLTFLNAGESTHHLAAIYFAFYDNTVRVCAGCSDSLFVDLFSSLWPNLTLRSQQIPSTRCQLHVGRYVTVDSPNFDLSWCPVLI